MSRKVAYRGFALLTVILFASLALPIVVILLSVVAVQTQYPRAEILHNLVVQLSRTGLREAEVNILDRPYNLLVWCDASGRRANDQYIRIRPGETASYIGAFWIRYPFLTRVDFYDGGAPENQGRRPVGSLVIYPSLLYQLDDLNDADCEPDNLTGGGNFSPPERVLLALPFMPFGKRFYAYSALNASGSKGDFLWNGLRYDPRQQLNWKPWDANPQPALGILTAFLANPTLWNYEFYLSGDVDKQDIIVNPYQREPYNRPEALFDPVMPAEGTQIPLQNQTLLDPATSQPLLFLPAQTRFEIGPGSIPAGYEVVVLDEDSLLPLYDYFHNPDDANFYNPVHNDNAQPPFGGLYEVIGNNVSARLEQAFRQQTRTLSWLAPGVGQVRASAILSHQAYYDIGDPGQPAGSTAVPNGFRDDYDGNQWVDEFQRPFPRSLKEILDVRNIRDNPTPGQFISRVTFKNLVPLVTLYSTDFLSNSIRDPILSFSANRTNTVNLWKPMENFPDADLGISGLDQPCNLPARPDGTEYPQDCLIPESSPVSVAQYNLWRNAFTGFDPLGTGEWMDPALFGAMLIDLNSTVSQELTDKMQELNFLSLLYDNPWDSLIQTRIVGHWAAWQYFFRYVDTTCHRLWDTSVGREWTYLWMEEHSRYHGIGDLLMPVPSPGTVFDPGNASDVIGCGGNRTGNSGLFPTLYVPVDRNNDGTFDPADPNDPYHCEPPNRDCYLPLIDDADGDGEVMGFDPVFWVPDRMPAQVLLDSNRMRLNDETLLFEVIAAFLQASAPVRTYFDSSAESKNSNQTQPDPDLVNEVCDPEGKFVQDGANALNGAYYPADGRNTGNFQCAQNPISWQDQDPRSWRPLYYRGKININTAPFPVLRALMAKTMHASADVNQPEDLERARIFALSTLKFREWFYFNDALSIDDAQQTSVNDWLNYNAFPAPFDFFFPYYGASLLTSYLLKRFELTGQGFRPYPISIDEALRRKISLPNEMVNPPFRNIAQLLDVARAEDPGDDPRDVTDNTRALAMDCWRSCFNSYLGGRASLSASIFSRIDQDIGISSSAFRFNSLGRAGSAVHGKTSIIRYYGPALEKEWVLKDDASIFHNYY